MPAELPGVAISGSTRLFVVLGDPVTQVQSPGLLNPLFARLGLDAVLVPVHARPEQLERIVRGLQCIANLDGIFITVPHKVAVCRFADRCSPMVDVTGSANVLRREEDGTWYAENFDGSGFVVGLVDAGHDPAGRNVSLVGAGGAGSAIAAALIAAGAERLTVCDLDSGKLDGLRARLEERWPGRTAVSTEPDLAEAHIVVNATPLGLRADDPLPFPPERLREECVVADIIMKPRETRLLREAAALGHPVHHGIHMLDGQIGAYREFLRLG
ncbi:shikimate dehydrogenase family protein [Actinacidiphila oryziradicis]|uniref:Shikimate dehydrogenase n=1 Tax=Actinacidiphila oryziradicis TaxID=2571141 RepID=A0A4U0S312_9ACTN|nr:shikimate dehydrogenase [Actinacidiphila oryziradicis]TKA01421.1 shikimate dehydrogenase [Actinacidiphila oryziradicis]